jgi:conjugative transfer region protein TrbK
MDDKRTLKIVVIAVLGAVALAAVIAFETTNRTPQPDVSASTVSDGHDPLDAELARCRDLGPDDPVDARCRAAWAESNRRFFGDDKPGR